MKKALIVDDIPEYIDTIEVYIEDCFEVLKAENFEEAMKILAKTSVDLAIIDIRLREDDPENKEGLELVRWIKEKKKEEEGRGQVFCYRRRRRGSPIEVFVK